MRNKEMGTEIPQEFSEQSQDEQFKKGGEQQETVESLLKEFQKEEEESLSSKDKDKEKTPKSRFKNALRAMTAVLILSGCAPTRLEKEIKQLDQMILDLSRQPGMDTKQKDEMDNKEKDGEIETFEKVKVGNKDIEVILDKISINKIIDNGKEIITADIKGSIMGFWAGEFLSDNYRDIIEKKLRDEGKYSGEYEYSCQVVKNEIDVVFYLAAHKYLKNNGQNDKANILSQEIKAYIKQIETQYGQGIFDQNALETELNQH